MDMRNTNRQDHIFALLEQREKMSVSELAEIFQVTETTIRRDLISMESNQQIIRKRGYAILPGRGYSIETHRRNTFREEKQRIARKAAEFISPNSTLALDSGTTVEMLVNILTEDYQNWRNLFIVTSSLSVATQSCRFFHTSIPGGLILSDEMSVSGVYTTNFFKNITTDIAFLGSTGIMNTHGLTVSYPPMLDIKRAIMACASKRIALLDSSKFVTRGIFNFCSFDELDVLITVETDQNAPALEEIASHGVEVILV